MKRTVLILAVFLVQAGCEEARDPDVLIGGKRFQLIEESGSFPSWSADGNDIVYAYRGDLYLVPWSGGESTESTQLTSLSGLEMFPSCSPVSGKREVVFIHKASDGDNTIYIMDLDAPDNLSEVYTSPRDLKGPSFTSDGSWIVFTELNRSGLRRVPVDGGEAVEITNEDGWDQINFSKASPYSNTVIYVESKTGVENLNRIAVDGGKPTQLTSFTGKDYPVNRIRAAAESYDGTRIVLSLSYNDPYFRYTLWTIPSSGTISFSQLSEVKDGQTDFPAWSPDGNKIAVEMRGILYVIELR